MSLQILFGNGAVNDEYYRGLTQNFELFGDSFKLGATPVNNFKISIAKEGVTTQPTRVNIYYNNFSYAHLSVDNIEETEYEYVYTLTDKMVDLEFNYDASQIFVDGKTTLLAIVQDICSKVGLTLDTLNFRGYDKEISWYDNTKTARQYIGYVAELNGGFARIERSLLKFVKQKTASRKTINLDECEDYNIGERHLITRVVYELGAVKWEYGTDTGNTLYLNSDNVFITEQSEVQAIFNDINNFEFYSFTTRNAPIDYTIPVGSIVTFTDGTNNYPTIIQYDLEYFGDWIGGYNLDVKTERQEETKIIPTAEHIKNLQITVNRHEGEIESKVQKDEVISTINQSAEAVTINANKININGTVSANGNFEIDQYGNVTIKDGDIYGASNITLFNPSSFAALNILDNDIGLYTKGIRITPFEIQLEDSVYNTGYNIQIYGDNDIPARVTETLQQGVGGFERNTSIGNNQCYTQWTDNMGTFTEVSYDGIITPTLTQTSKEENKKNFEKLQNALDIIKNIDIYKYNMKTQEDGAKKHIGFVIGKDYKYSDAITSSNNEGVDTYSMVSVAYKAIQEQQEMIEQLQKEISELKSN